MRRILLGIKTIRFFVYSKIRYGKRLELHLMNSIRGKINIDIQDKGKCSVGHFLMTQGPLYIKCVQSGVVKIGDYCFFNHNCSITCAESITIGSHCMIANNCVIIDHNHNISDGIPSSNLKTSAVVIGNNVWIGANVTILKGVTIGDGVVIGAGSVVTKSIPQYSVAYGLPARIHKSNN